MISDWMPHGNISEYVNSNSEANRLRLLCDVASGLEYLHSKSLVHGDLKGANMLVNAEYHAVLADFGLVAVISNSSSMMTVSTSISGTARWMAPELLNPEEYGFQHCSPSKESDVYALWMVIYEVMTGNIPFSHCSAFAVIRKIMDGVGPERLADTIYLPDELWEIIQNCWKQRCTERTTVRDVLDRLGQISIHWTTPLPLPAASQLDVEDDWEDLTWPSPSEFDNLDSPTSLVFKATCNWKQIDIPILDTLLASRRGFEEVIGLCGLDAIAVMNLLDQALQPPEIEILQQRRYACALGKLCASCGSLPPSHTLSGNVEIIGPKPHSSGWFADVWVGRCHGHQVAVTVPKIYEKNGIEKVKKQFLKKTLAWRRLSHPNLLPFFGVADIPRFWFCIVSEWMEFSNIIAYMHSNPDANPLILLHDVASGLVVFHEDVCLNEELSPCTRSCYGDILSHRHCQLWAVVQKGGWHPEQDFFRIKDKTLDTLKEIGYAPDSVIFVPMDASLGEKLMNYQTPKWYSGWHKETEHGSVTGISLWDAIDSIETPMRRLFIPLHVVVLRKVNDVRHDRGHFICRVLSGVLRPGMSLTFCPGNFVGVVGNILVDSKTVGETRPGEDVDVCFANGSSENGLYSRQMGFETTKPPARRTASFIARLVINSTRTGISARNFFRLSIYGLEFLCLLHKVLEIKDHNGQFVKTRQNELKDGEICRAAMLPITAKIPDSPPHLSGILRSYYGPLFLEPHQDFPELGRIALDLDFSYPGARNAQIVVGVVESVEYL